MGGRMIADTSSETTGTSLSFLHYREVPAGKMGPPQRGARLWGRQSGHSRSPSDVQGHMRGVTLV